VKHTVVLSFVIAAMALTACSGSGSVPSNPSNGAGSSATASSVAPSSANTRAEAPLNGRIATTPLRITSRHSAPRKSALYVLNATNSSDYSVSIYSQDGAKYLRSISSTTVGDGGTIGFTADSLGNLYLSQELNPRFFLLNVYVQNGAKIQRARKLKQKRPFNSLAVDMAGNVYTSCPPGTQLCEYTKKKLMRRFEANGPIATDFSGNVAALQRNQSSVGEYALGQDKPYWIAGGVNNTLCGLAFDSSGNLYGANTIEGMAGDVVVYAPKATSPTLTITSGIDNPVGIAIDSKDNLYVLNVPQSGASVSVYARGQRTPSETITDGVVGVIPVYGGGSPIAIDSADNLYVANQTESVTVYSRGSIHPSRTITDGISRPVAIAI
jgi:hypothetical protein